MVCYQCGGPMSPGDEQCPNCGAPARKRATREIKLPAEGLERYTQKLRAITPEDRRLLPEGEAIADRFELGVMIGRGSFGQVYEARDTELEVTSAIKVFRPEVIESAAARKRFEAALKSARKMTQKNVVRVHAHGFHEGHAWVSMQHLEGLTLRKVMKLRASKEEAFELPEVERIVEQLVAALGHINQKYPHGDLKPENVVLLPDTLKVTDHFVVNALGVEAVAEKLAEGGYFAPELRGEDASLLPRCDIYALGALVSELLFGSARVPAEDDPSITSATLEAVAAACRRATSEDPEERYQTFEAFSEDFAAAIDTGELLSSEAEEVAATPPAPPVPPATSLAEVSSAPPPPPAAPPVEEAEEAEEAEREEQPSKGDGGKKGRRRRKKGAKSKKKKAGGEKTSPKEREGGDEGEDAEVLDELPEDEIATVEVGRRGGDEGKPELGDLLPTNEVDRVGIKLPEGSEPKLEPTQTVVAPKPNTGKEDESGGIPWWAIPVGIGALIVIVVAIQIGTPEKKVVNVGDESEASASKDAGDAKGADASAVASAKDMGQGADAGVDDGALAAAVSQASTAQSAAHASALDMASKRAAELAAADMGQADMGQASAAPDMAAAVAKKEPTADGQRPPTGDGKTSAKTGAKKDPKDSGKKDAAPAAAGTDCPQGMTLVRSKKAGNVCIDRYEFPGRGATPKTRVSWFDAKKSCESKGKRLCSRAEWSRACGGKYPWGRKWDPNKCNTADEDGFERSLAKAGSLKSCRSRSGAYDMVGNVFEWTAEKRIVGGSFNSDEGVASCRYSSAKSPSSSASDIGFRCCADPK